MKRVVRRIAVAVALLAGAVPAGGDVAAIGALRGWDASQGLAPLNAAAREVQAAANEEKGRADAAAGLAGLLGSGVASQVRKFACEQLAIAGGEGEIAALAALLGDAELETPARGAIERIGGAKAAAALRDACVAAEPAAKAGLLGSLAKLRDAGAVSLAAKALEHEDAALREAALVALGRIGGGMAREALLAAEGRIPAGQRRAWAAALLECAEGLAGSKSGDADTLLEKLMAPGWPSDIRTAAFSARLRVSAEPRDAIVSALKGNDGAMAEGAMQVLRGSGSDLVRQCHRGIAAAFEAMPAAVQVRVMDIFVAADVREGATLARLVLAGGEAANREAALRALGALGSEPDFDILFGGLTGDVAGHRAAAADGLAALCAGSTDGRLIALLASAREPVAPIVIDVLARRNARSAAPALLAVARGSNAEAARAAVKAIGELAGAAMIPGLVDVVSKGGPAAGAAAQLIARLGREAPEAVKARLTAVMPLAADSAQGTLAKILAIIDGSGAPGGGAVRRGRNLAAGGRAESPTGLKRDGAAGGPEAAIDGNPKTYWDEENGQPEYRLRVTLPREETIACLQITGFKHQDFAPRDFSILCDGRDVKKVAGAEYADNQLAVDLPPTKCRAVELVITGCYGDSPAIRELEMFGPAEKGKTEKAQARKEAK